MQDYFDIEIDDEWFDAINKGEKHVEIRKNSQTWQHIREDSSTGLKMKLRIVPKLYKDQKRKPFLVEVVYVNIYKGKDPLFEALTSEGINKVLPGKETITEASEIYLKLPGWTAKQIRELGIKAIGIQKI